MMSNLSCQKHLFSLDEGVIFLNCAYMAPLLKTVEAAGIEGIRRKLTPSAIESKDFFTETDRARELYANLIGCDDPQRFAIVPSASYGLAAAARNLSIKPHQNVVVLDEQFPSNVYTWQRFCGNGAKVRSVRPPDELDNRGEVWNERVLNAIDEHTAIVAMPHIHWANGSLFDLEAIGQRTRDVGAALIIDATQSIGALPFDQEKIQADVVVCGGYKALLGPYSIGMAYFGPRFDDGIPLEENWVNRINSENFSRLIHYESEYQPGALRYDVGERSNFILLPMLIAAMEQLLAWGPENTQVYCRGLVRPFAEAATKLGYWIEDEAWRASNLFGVGLPNHIDVQTLNDLLKSKNIFVSVRGSYIRISPHVYNDASDMETLLDVLKQVA
jgi:selenocysteine lyase/cysteine desulfurase